MSLFKIFSVYFYTSFISKKSLNFYSFIQQKQNLPAQKKHCQFFDRNLNTLLSFSKKNYLHCLMQKFTSVSRILTIRTLCNTATLNLF